MKKMAALLVLAFLLWPLTVLAETTVKLTWDPPENVTGITGYIMEQKVSTDAWAEIGRVTAPPYSDTISTARQPICWRVRAYNALEKSDPSNEFCLSLPMPPRNLTVVVTVSVQENYGSTPVPKRAPRKK